MSSSTGSSSVRHASTAFSAAQNFHQAGQNQESGRSGWFGRRGSSASVSYATAATGGHVADGATHGGGSTAG